VPLWTPKAGMQPDLGRQITSQVTHAFFCTFVYVNAMDGESSHAFAAKWRCAWAI